MTVSQWPQAVIGIGHVAGTSGPSGPINFGWRLWRRAHGAFGGVVIGHADFGASISAPVFLMSC